MNSRQSGMMAGCLKKKRESKWLLEKTEEKWNFYDKMPEKSEKLHEKTEIVNPKKTEKTEKKQAPSCLSAVTYQ